MVEPGRRPSRITNHRPADAGRFDTNHELVDTNHELAPIDQMQLV